MVARLASGTGRPLMSSAESTPSAGELIASPSPEYASPSQSAGGSVVRMIGRPNALANSQSRWSPPGTPITAPVP